MTAVSALKPGDIILTKPKGTNILSDAIEWFQEGPYSHTTIYKGDNIVLDTAGGGTQYMAVQKYLNAQKYSIKVLRLKLPEHRARIPKVLKYIEKRIGKKYSILQLFIYAWYFLLKKITGKDYRKGDNVDVDDEANVCSEMVAWAFLKSGIGQIRPNIVPSLTTPEDFNKDPRDLFKTILIG